MHPDTPYSVFADYVLPLYAPPVRRRGTYYRMQAVLREFGEVCNTVGDVDAHAVPRWLKLHQDRSAVTNLSMLGSFRAACNLGAKLLPTSPFASRGPKDWFPETDLDEDPRRRFHSEDDVRRILAQADFEVGWRASKLKDRWRARRMRALVYTLVYTGARRNEILGMRVEDVVIEDRLIHIRPNAKRRLKTRSSRAVLPIPPRLVEVLTWWMPLTESEWLFPGERREGPWFGGIPGCKPGDQVKKLGERAGVMEFTPLSARHTFATLAEGWGWGEAMIQRFLRHSTPITQRHYRHADLAQMADAADRILRRPA